MEAKITTEPVAGGFSYVVEIDDGLITWSAQGEAVTEPKAVVLAQLAVRQHYAERTHQEVL